jgi:hypothetical protein
MNHPYTHYLHADDCMHVESVVSLPVSTQGNRVYSIQKHATGRILPSKIMNHPFTHYLHVDDCKHVESVISLPADTQGNRVYRIQKHATGRILPSKIMNHHYTQYRLHVADRLIAWSLCLQKQIRLVARMRTSSITNEINRAPSVIRSNHHDDQVHSRNHRHLSSGANYKNGERKREDLRGPSCTCWTSKRFVA